MSPDRRSTGELLGVVDSVGIYLKSLAARDGTMHEISAVVDQLESVGVDGYFTQDIADLLRMLQIMWKSYVGNDGANLDSDLLTTATTFCLLRTHSCDVDANPLAKFVKEGQIMVTGSDLATQVRAILKLKLAAELMLSGEDFLTEIRRTTTESLERIQKSGLTDCQLSSEIKHGLDFGWCNAIPIVNILHNVHMYEERNVWVGSPSIRVLALQTLKLWQPMLGRELHTLQRWNENCRIPELSFVRSVAKLMPLVAVSNILEPQYRAARITWSKVVCLLFFVDDLFDEYSSIDELRTFTGCVRRWDPQLPESCTEPAKIIYNALYSTTNDISRYISQVQGRDLQKSSQRLILKLVEAMMKETEWSTSRLTPSFNEYIKVGIISSGIETIMGFTAFCPGFLLSDEDTEGPDCKSLLENCSLIGRYINDVKSYEREVEVQDGKSNSVAVILHESGGTMGKAEATARVMKLMDESKDKVVNLLLSPQSSIPTHMKQLYLFCMRACILHGSANVDHPFIRCIQGRPDDTPNFHNPLLVELTEKMREVRKMPSAPVQNLVVQESHDLNQA